MFEIYIVDSLEQVSEADYQKAINQLAPDDRKKVLSFHRKCDRVQRAATQLLLSYILKKHLNEDAEIARSFYGKPYLPKFPNFYFNVSHCGKACVVVTANCPVGVDIQDFRPYSREIACRVCTKDELLALDRSLDPKHLFIQIWTMKEAYFKMLGTGLPAGISDYNTVQAKEIIFSKAYPDYHLSLAADSSLLRREEKGYELDHPTEKHLEFAEVL